MGIGRRQFLKMFGATIATAAANPLQAVVLSENLYINRALGIAFRKPAGWFFMSIKEFSHLKNGQVLKDDELSDQLRGAEDPLVVMTKINPLEKSIGPAITVYVEPFEYEEGETLIGFLPGLEATYQKVLPEYKQIGDPLEKYISNCESVEYYSEFLYEHESFKVKARNRCLITIREPQIYTVNMFDYPSSDYIAQKEYDEFLSSLHYV